MSDETDDEFTAHPDSTSVADADWLAEMRSKASSSEQTLADLLTDDPADAEPGTIEADADAGGGREEVSAESFNDADDSSEDAEITITHAGGIDAIRSLVAEHRATEAPQTPDFPEVPETPETPGIAPPEPTAVPSDHETPAIRSAPSDPGPATRPPGGAFPPRSMPTTPPEQRWIAPPRLAAADAARHEPLVLVRPQEQGRSWTTYAAVAAALIIGFAAAFFLLGRNDSQNEEPPATTIGAIDEEGAGQ